MRVEESLRQQYPNAKIETVSSNGQVVGYFAKSTGISMYVPTSVANNSNVNMVSYLPGSGGAGNDAAKLREQIANNPPNYIISISSECYDKYNCIESGYNVASAANGKVTNNVTVCFSASGFMGLQRTEEFLEKHPEVKSTVVSSEPYNQTKFKVQNATALKKSQTPIVFAAPDSGFHINMMDYIKNFKENGLNTYLLETDYTSGAHIATNRDVLTSGMLEYVLGLKDSFDTTRAGGYDFIKYDTATGKFVNADYKEIAGQEVIKIPNLSDINASDSFTIETKTSPVNEKYASLKSIDSIGDASLVEFSSDYGLVRDHMNNIRSLIKSSSFLGGVSNFGFRSSSGIPGCITKYINAYYDIVGSLLNSISMETESVVSYAEAIVKMDKELAEDINKGKSGTITEKDNSSKYIAIGLEEEKEEEKPKEETPKEETPKEENPPAGTTPPEQEGTPQPVYGAPFAQPMYGAPIPTPEEETPQNPCYDETIPPNYIYRYGDFDLYIYTDANNKVIGAKYRYTFDNAEASAKKLAELQQQYKSYSFVKEVIAKDKYIDVIFTDEAIKGKTKDDLAQTIQGGGPTNGTNI